jgi:2-polyprenyl-6-methoxyphenol hydroxylase-like FAD-dependent oxidoreductase
VAHIVVCGGSIIGLSSAMLLARDGHLVTVLETDPAPVPELPADAWEGWDRKGVPQFHQPHHLFSRARQILDADLPGMTDGLLEAGCVWVDPLSSLPPRLTDKLSHEDRLCFVTGRRPVMEAVFARAADRHPAVTVRRGVSVRGLLAEAGTTDGAPHVEGVKLDGGEELRGELVVDAMGRRTKLGRWLEALGGPPPQVESEDSGFVYYTRYFTGPEQPVVIGPAAAELGTISVLTALGDNSTWSVTLWGASADAALRGLREAERFTNVVRACLLQAHWLGGEPITDVLVMAGILDRYRRFVVDGRPVATGVVAVGDAWACTNPSAGRGLSVGLIHAQRLRDVVREGLDDANAVVRRFDAITERDVTPFYRNQIAADRARIAEMDALRVGSEPPPEDPATRAVRAAMMHDPDVFRGVIETVLCLALPQEVFARSGFMDKVAAFSGESPMAIPGPSRTELLDLVR